MINPANSPPLSHLLQVEHVGGDVIAPLIVTLGTLLLDLPVPGSMTAMIDRVMDIFITDWVPPGICLLMT